MYKEKNKTNHQKKCPIHYIKLTCQLSFRNMKLKVDRQTQGMLYQKLITQSIVCNSDIKEVRGKSVCFKVKAVDINIIGRRMNVEKVFHKLKKTILGNWQNPVHHNHCIERVG